MNTYFNSDGTAPPKRSRIIERTMGLFALVLAAHTGLTYLLYALAPSNLLSPLTNPYILVGVVMAILAASGAVGFLAHRSSISKPIQLAALGIYVLLEAVLFLPLIQIGVETVGLGVLVKSSILSASLFAGLAGYVFHTKADFTSWDRYIFASLFGALGLTLLALLTGFHTSVLFSGGMVVLGSIWVLYDASNLVHRYGEDEYIAATMDLFSSFAFTLWHILRLIIR